MANQIFKGEVIESADGTFMSKPRHEADIPQQIVGWNITLLTSPTTQKRFFCKREGGMAYNDAKLAVIGDEAIVHCVARPGYGSEPKWEPIQIELPKNTAEKTGF